MKSEPEQENSAMEKLSRLMALLVVKDMAEVESLVTLATCGFTNNEIASLLGKEPVTVRSYLHRHKKISKKKASRNKA